MPSAQSYFVHDNGGRPFKITIDKDSLSLYRSTEWDPEWVYEDEPYFTLSLKGKKVFLPESHPKTPDRFVQPSQSSARGNTILVELAPNVYLYIGGKVYIFETKDKIEKYYSPIGNSDVPYPWAVGTENFYFLIEQAVLPRSAIATPSMPYDDLYGSRNSGPEPKYRVRMVLDSSNDNMLPSRGKVCYRYGSRGCKYFYPPQLSKSFLDYLN